MSLKKIKYAVPEHQAERIEVACDLCQRPATVRYHTNYSRITWPSRDNYAVLETVVLLEDGDRYPEGGSTTTTEFHVCPDCFRNKLVPWFASQEVSATHEEHDT